LNCRRYCLRCLTGFAQRRCGREKWARIRKKPHCTATVFEAFNANSRSNSFAKVTRNRSNSRCKLRPTCRLLKASWDAAEGHLQVQCPGPLSVMGFPEMKRRQEGERPGRGRHVESRSVSVERRGTMPQRFDCTDPIRSGFFAGHQSGPTTPPLHSLFGRCPERPLVKGRIGPIDTAPRHYQLR